MLLTLDLTSRQAARVIEQAVRTQAKIELEPRTVEDVKLIGTLRKRDGAVLVVDLHESGESVDPLTLMGAICEIRTRLSGQFYLFSTCVLDVPDATVPGRLLLAVPENIQVANRRRYERTNATVASQVRIWVSESDSPFVGLVASVSASGLAAAMPGAELDDRVLLGDRVRLRFELAGFDGAFELPAMVCNKSVHKQAQETQIGVEFAVDPGDATGARELGRLRAALFELASDFNQPDGA